MAKKTRNTDVKTTDYRHTGEKRTNIPPAKIAAEGKVPRVPKVRYQYSPHLAPLLQFDGLGKADKLRGLLTEAGRRSLTESECKLLTNALSTHEPWLEWAGRREQNERGFFEVDPVALHIHERVSTQAMLRVVAREDVQRDLFADPQQAYAQAVQFYKHDVDWANRLILGDSLQVMASLARRESLGGKVQMIYIDPPYGISFRSNFQPDVRNLQPEDKQKDLTREPEMVKAYRDTWTLGVHSYLSYLRERMVMARELLSDSGSIFVQISDENIHRVRCLLDELFGVSNFITLLTFTKKGSQSGDFVPAINEYVVWYAKDRDKALTKFRPIYIERLADGPEDFAYCELESGEVIPAKQLESRKPGGRVRFFSSNALFSQKRGPNDLVELCAFGKAA
jgi:adenine-specific DNA-methyltransferase